MQIGTERVFAAEFSLAGTTVLVTYHRPEAKRLIEGGAVRASTGRPLYPKDGREFFDRIDVSFSRSTMVHVEAT